MREIKFRGKTVDTGNWVYGSYQADVMLIGKHTIIYSDYDGYYCEEEIIPETIGQYTGLKDKNGKEIYEGDILEIANGEGSLRSVVEYHAPSFCHRWLNLKEAKLRGINVEPLLWNTHIIFKVIGNIYEHPHLLEVKGNE